MADTNRLQLRASNNRCEEKYVKAIARELAIGLLSIHEANIIHRDLKGNRYVGEMIIGADNHSKRLMS